MSKKRKTRLTRISIGMLILIVLLGVTATIAFAYTPPTQVQETLEGCRFTTGLTLPNADGKYICADGNYTTGNLAKGWNELDLVPHRLTTQLGNQSGATTDYNLIIAGDYFNGGTAYGWDVISAPVVNTEKSDASCTVSAGSQILGGPITGGAQSSYYRELTIHQAKGTTCVFDYYQRLALGAAQYSGSSLQSYMFEGNDFKSGKKTLSIPVREALPQELSKTMTATQGTDHVWDVSKSPSPANLAFTNTCDAGAAKQQNVSITVNWEIKPANPNGPVTIITHVNAKNPAARSVTINVTDKIFKGAGQLDADLLDTANASNVVIPANMQTEVLTHQFVWQSPDPLVTIFNDVATATYTDTVANVPIPGTVVAQASATTTYTGPELNKSAIITDSESISGTGLTFSANSFTPPGIGSFDSPYVAGTATVGPVGWTSLSQTATGSVTFNKTVYVAGPSIVDGDLSDTATITGSDGFTKSAPGNVDVTTNALVSLTINKTIDVAQAADATFGFQVMEGSNIVNASVTVKAGDLSGSVVVPGLKPNTLYTVSEETQNAWVSEGSKTVQINLPSCSGSVDFANVVKKDLKVEKTANPSFTRTFDWTIDKSVNKDIVYSAGGGESEPVEYTVAVTKDAGTDSAFAVSGVITVTNPNEFAVNGVSLVDDSCTVTPATVDVPAKVGSVNGTATADYTCSFGANPGSGTNTATASWTSFGSPNASASGAANYAFGAPTALVNDAIDVTDTNPGVGPWHFTTSGSIKYSKTFTDPAGTCTTHENTATITGTATLVSKSDIASVTDCQGADLNIEKTANPSFTRKFTWGITKSVDGDALKNISGGTATFNYKVDVTHDAGADSLWKVTGEIRVSNPNDWQAISADITDALPDATCLVDGAASKSVTVQPGLSVTVPYECSFAAQPAYNNNLTNTATATWANTYYTPNTSAQGQQVFQFKDPTTIIDGSVTVTDDKAGTLGTAAYTDASPKSFNYSLEFPGVAGVCTDYNNTATFTTITTQTTGSSSAKVTVCMGLDLTVSKTANPAFTRTYDWTIDKSVDKPTVYSAGGGESELATFTVAVTKDAGTDSLWVVSGMITISNPNNFVDVTLTDLSDAVPGGNCTVADPVAPATSYVIPKGGSLDVAYSCTFATQPAYNTDITNTATATWDQAAAHTPNGTASGGKVFQFKEPTSKVNDEIDVTDTNSGVGPWHFSASGSVQYTKTYTDPAGTCTSHENTATITQLNKSDTATVKDCQGLDLIVTKDVAPAFTRTFTWGIAKDVDKTSVNLEGTNPQSATFNYTVNVTHDAGTDSLWALSGTITVSNPNDWEAIVLNDVTDVAGATTCTVNKSGGMSVPANGTKTFPYTCSMPNGTAGDNVATATWDKDAAHTPTGTDNGSAGFAFTTPTTIIDGSVTVTDTLGGNLGTVSYTDPSPTALKYSKSFQGVPGECQSFDNTATFTTNTTATTGSASKTVTVCASVLNVIKLTKGAVDPNQSWTFVLKNASGNQIASDGTSGKADGLMDFGNYLLDPAKKYTFCETNAPAGWASIWYFDANGDGVFDPASETITPYNPDQASTPPQDLGNRCVDFGAGTSYAIPTGGVIRFQVDNRYPGGQPRTIGYWKNWSTCTGGNQVRVAARNGGPAAGWYLLDDLLPQTLGTLAINNCEAGVNILGKKTIVEGKNKANDAAYNMAAQLLAAQLNAGAGARTCPAVQQAIVDANALLTAIGFDGNGDFLGPKVKGDLLAQRAQALGLANTLDLYNNGQLCP